MERKIPKSKYRPKWEIPFSKLGYSEVHKKEQDPDGFGNFNPSDEGDWVEQLHSKIDVYWALKKLPPKQRGVIQLRMDGYTIDEIAEMLGMSPRSVSYNIAKSRKILRGLKPKSV